MRVYTEFEQAMPFHKDDVLDYWEALIKAHSLSGD
jgi:hypothetical protein